MVTAIGRPRHLYVDFRDEGVRRSCSRLVKVGLPFGLNLKEEKVKESSVAT